MAIDIAVAQDDLVVFSLWGRIYGQETRTEYGYVQTYNEDIDLLAGWCGFFEAQKLPVICGMSAADLSYFNLRADVWTPIVDGYDSVGWRDYGLSAYGSVGASGSALPPNNCLVMRRRVGPAGRSNRGRVYLPGVPTGWQTGGVLAGGAVVDAVNNFKSEMAGPMRDGSTPTPLPIGEPILIKKTETGFPDSIQVVNYWDVNNAVRSQRRREPGVGI